MPVSVAQILTHALSGITIIFISDKEPKYRIVRLNTGHLATLGWMDAWIDGWVDGYMDAWIHGCMDSWMHEFMDAWIRGCMNSWMHGFVDAWMDGLFFNKNVLLS